MADHLGVVRADITPSNQIDLCGFASRTGPWEAIRSRLSAEVFVFGKAVRGTQVPEAVLVTADLVWWGPDVAPLVRADIADRIGISVDAVFLHATHTHGGPATSLQFSSAIGRPDTGYIRDLGRLVAEAAERAAVLLEPVTMLRGRAEAGIGVNRRRVNPDGSVGGPDPDGDIDREVVTIRYVRGDGSTVGMLVHFACHPSTCADHMVSADFPGVVKTDVEARLGSGIVGFLQGCSGDIRVDLVDEGSFRAGTDADVLRLGGELARAVEHACADERIVAPAEIRARTSTAELPLLNPSQAALARRREAGGIWAEWSAKLEAQPDRIVPTVPIQLSAMRLADGFAILGFDAEVSVAYGHFVKHRSRGRVLPVGYTNGMIGYVVTSDQLRLGGYEPAESYAYIYRPGSFDPSIEVTVREAIERSLCVIEQKP